MSGAREEGVDKAQEEASSTVIPIQIEVETFPPGLIQWDRQ